MEDCVEEVPETSASLQPVKKNMATQGKKGKTGLDVSIKFFDNFIRVMDAIKKSLDAEKERNQEIDAMINNGVGFVEDKKLTHGLSMGAMNTGVYGGTDLVYNANSGDYLVMTKMGEIIRYSWCGQKQGTFQPSKMFTRFIHMPLCGYYVAYSPGKSAMYLLKEDLNLAMDTVCISPIDRIVYAGGKTEEGNYEYFCIYQDSVNKYAFNPTGNTVVLQECLKIADIEAEQGVIEQVCFDSTEGAQKDKAQWLYLTFKQHCTIIDASGRSHGTKKNLHKHPITAIVAIGASEFVITGDFSGLVKMWGPRWTIMMEFRPHASLVSHLIEHPIGRAVVSFSTDQSIFAWSLDTLRKLESLIAPEIGEKIATNQQRKSFMVLGPRKLVLWKMDVLFTQLKQMGSPISGIEMTWNPDYTRRTIVTTTDNAVRLLNPITGNIISTALVNPLKPPIVDTCYIPQYGSLYVIKPCVENVATTEIQIFDCTLNPAKPKVEVWNETKWNDNAVTAMALFDQIQSMVVPEKAMAFQTKKTEVASTYTTFLIAGFRDGTIGRLDLRTGDLDFKVTGHKGNVVNIQVNPEVSQFVSVGLEPSIRIWKVFLNQEELFVPIFEITWKYPVRHVAFIREAVCFVLSHHESPTHKVVVFNMLDTERHDHRARMGHTKEILSVSGSRELKLFCSSSLDETVRVWNDKCDLIRLLALNWVPTYAAFGTTQADIFVGIGDSVHFIAADTYLPIIYRNRAMVYKVTAGASESSLPLNQKTTQDPRMYIIYEEEERKEREAKEMEKDKNKEKKRPGAKKEDGAADKDIRIPRIESFREPLDSQRAKDYEKFKFLDDDLKQIIEGNHNFSIYVPDFHKMSKKMLDDYGKGIFTGADGDKRKMFAAESRVAGQVEMERAMKDLDNFQEDY